jgi:hypothetical protein
VRLSWIPIKRNRVIIVNLDRNPANTLSVGDTFKECGFAATVLRPAGIARTHREAGFRSSPFPWDDAGAFGHRSGDPPDGRMP